MKEQNLKRFSLIFCLLLVFQEACALARITKPTNGRFEKNETSLPSKSRSKRSIGGILIGISTISAGIDIYKQAAGCDDFTSELKPTIAKAKELQVSNNARAEDINVAWVPIESKESYVERMASDLDIIRAQLINMNALQVDIITLLDQSLLDKLNEFERTLENDIEANNVTDIGKFEDLEAKFMDAGQFALTLSLKLAPAALWLSFGGFQKIYSYTVNSVARTWSSSNPAKVERVLGKYAETGFVGRKIQEVKSFLNAKWIQFQINHPGFQTTLNRFRNLEGVQRLGRGLSKVKAAIVGTGTVLFTGFLLGYEVFNLVEFKKSCEEKLAQAQEGYATFIEQEKNLTSIESRMDELLLNSTEYYNQMKNNLTNPEILNYLADIVELGKNALNQTDKLKSATADVESYIINIQNPDNDDARVDELNKILIAALGNINFKLDCLHSKVSIIGSIKNDCYFGSGTFAEIFEIAQQKERSSISEECLDSGYMNEKEIQEITDAMMIELGKQPECSRNNEEKQNLICRNWYDDVSDEDNMKSADVSKEDLAYFINTCPPGPVSDNIISVVCAKKAAGTTSSEIVLEYYKLESETLQDEYSKCQLTDAQKVSICLSKVNGFTINDAKENFALYPEDEIEQAFNSCGPSKNITPFDQTMICMYINSFKAEDSQVMQIYGVRYEHSVIVAQIEICRSLF